MPNDVTLSAEEYQALLAERDALRGELRLVTAERDLAEERLRAYRHELFGASSEARDADQLGLFNEAESLASGAAVQAREDEPSTRVAGHSRSKRGRKPLDAGLSREVVRHELPQSERFCAHDGHALIEIGIETSEQLDVVPEQVRVIQHQRVKYACPCCDLGIKVTPAPARIIPRGLLTESALAWIITGKYQYGMPLYRQATLLRRFGGDISSNTLAASVVRVGQAVQPVINLMRDVLLESELIHGDETTFQVLKEPGRRPQAKSYLWAQVNGSGPPVRMFSYSPGRGAQHAQRLYAGVKPGTVLMTDGYELYNGIAHDHQLVHLGCWAHVRRGFIKAEENVPKAARTRDLLATRFIVLIGKLFAAEARSTKWKPERRQRLRARYSARVLAIIERMMIEHLLTVMPSSLLGRALQYMSGQWPKLVRYIDDGSWPISNNLCENAIRPFVIGRKGWLFSDTVAGAQASANLYSLVETCKANGIDAYRYLAWLFMKLPLAETADDYAALLPWSEPVHRRSQTLAAGESSQSTVSLLP
ncbi:IS66 family transposase [Paraburkholderia sp. SOS3]|uniref:IS66 family transposase n=1 Tax=Paraburkholderia sp. SOS3 TaxID=1926494 RepID=UPI000947744B|nr:IS66 family transposase [Paraburkholderia sp. SOS3]APR34337.1 transposase [Paraburkholderia sp. SOS3]APR35713.1 transposase [Paraburkholderia sp. SOS3]